MNSFVCLVLLAAVASAQVPVKPYTGSFVPAYSQQPFAAKYYSAPVDIWKSGLGSWSHSVQHTATPYKFAEMPSVYSIPVPQAVEIKPKTWIAQSAAPVFAARSESSEWKVEPASWTAPATWSSAGYYSAAPVEKQVVAKKVAAPAVKVDQPQPVDSVSKLVSYSTEITHEVPAKKEQFSYVSAPAAPISAPVAPKVASTPLQYSAWSEEPKPVEVKPASWATEAKAGSWAAETKPASWAPEANAGSWASEVKPASWAPEAKVGSWASEVKHTAWAPEAKVGSWASEVKPATWTAEVKPATWTAEIKPSTYAWTEPKPASWASWSEAKPWASYVSPVQPTPVFYGASSWASPAPVVQVNAQPALSAPWASTWSTTHPVASFEKRSERKPF